MHCSFTMQAPQVSRKASLSGPVQMCSFSPHRGKVQGYTPNAPAWWSSAAAGAAIMLLIPQLAQAHTALDKLPPLQQQQLEQRQRLGRSMAGFEPDAAAVLRGGGTSSSSSSSTRSRGQQQPPVASEASVALQELQQAYELLKQGDYAAALQGYTQLVSAHPDLALTEYARLGRAMCLYQEGSTDQALTALNELELELRGNPETHAALAAVLYAERPAQLWRAEEQFDIAVEFDRRYQDVAWVRESKHWPPRLLQALDRFLMLK